MKMDREQELEEQERINLRIEHQRDNSDYAYEGGSDEAEKCGDCNSWLNSRGHCPRCDY